MEMNRRDFIIGGAAMATSAISGADQDNNQEECNINEHSLQLKPFEFQPEDLSWGSIGVPYFDGENLVPYPVPSAVLDLSKVWQSWESGNNMGLPLELGISLREIKIGQDFGEVLLGANTIPTSGVGAVYRMQNMFIDGLDKNKLHLPILHGGLPIEVIQSGIHIGGTFIGKTMTTRRLIVLVNCASL